MNEDYEDISTGIYTLRDAPKVCNAVYLGTFIVPI